LTHNGESLYAPAIEASACQPANGNPIFTKEGRQQMTPNEMQEKAMHIFGQGLQ
jgi:hypothetical protein